MRSRSIATLLGLVLAGCAAGPTSPAASDTVIGIVGTPFLLALKIPVCAATLAIAGPLAGAAALAPEASGSGTERALGEGVVQNCGPPYAVVPQYGAPPANPLSDQLPPPR